MKIRKIIILSLFFASFSYGLFCEEEARAPVFARPARGTINIRIDSTLQSGLLGVLADSDIVQILKKKYEWCKVVLPARFSGYIYKKYVKVIEDEEGQGVVTASRVNIRSAPSVESSVLGMVSRGNVLLIRGSRGDWYKIRAYPYGTGWVYGKLLKELSKKEARKRELVDARELVSFLKEVPQENEEEEPEEEDLFRNENDGSFSSVYPQGFGYIKQDKKDEEPGFTEEKLLVEGVLKKNIHTSLCPVGYKITNNHGVVLLNTEAPIDDIVYKKVRVWGEYVF